MGYLKETIKGVSWMGGLRASTRVIAFIKIAILARLLLPEQFGLFGIAALVLAFLEILTETGINVFFIQGEGKIEDYINTTWLVSILRGTLISLVIILLAPVIASFFNSPDSYSILLFISFVPFLRGFINPAIVRFRKELQFNKEFLFRFSIFSFDAVVAIIFALITRSALSLVWGLTAGVLLEIALSFLIVSPKPRFAFEFAKIRKIVGRGKWVTVYSIFNYLFENGDDIVVGRLMGTSSLGLYQVAYKISSLPITEVTNVFGKVTFPVFVKMSRDARRLKKAFAKTALGISVIVIPIGLVLFLFPREVVLVLLGERWLDVVPVLKMLAIFGTIRAILATPNAVFLALKKQEYITATTFAGMLGLAVTIIPLVSRYGIVGAAISAIIGTLVSLPVITYYTWRVFNQSK